MAAAVTRAGGLGVLGAGMSPEQLEIELAWMDDNVDGKPYGADVVMPQKSLDVHGADREQLVGHIRSMIDQEHWDYVAGADGAPELPPLLEGHEGRWRGRLDRGRRGTWSTCCSPIPSRLIAVLGRRRRTSWTAHEQGVLVAALAGRRSTPSAT